MIVRIPLKVTSRSRSKLPVIPVQKYHPIHGKVTAWAVAELAFIERGEVVHLLGPPGPAP